MGEASDGTLSIPEAIAHGTEKRFRQASMVQRNTLFETPNGDMISTKPFDADIDGMVNALAGPYQ